MHKECEEIQEKLNEIDPDFLIGVDIIRRELMKIHDDFHWTSKLCGACAISAYLVFRYAKKLGLKARFVYCKNHCYTLVEDFVVDATATQFTYSASCIERSRPFFNTDSILLAKSVETVCGIWDYYEPRHILSDSASIFKKTQSWKSQDPCWFLDDVDDQWLQSLNKRLGLKLKRQNKTEGNCA